MNIQTTLQIRIEENLKEKASEALKSMGLDLTSGIKLFLNEVVTSETIPFFPSTEHGKKLRYYKLYKKEVNFAKKNGKRFATGKSLLDDALKS